MDSPADVLQKSRTVTKLLKRVPQKVPKSDVDRMKATASHPVSEAPNWFVGNELLIQ